MLEALALHTLVLIRSALMIVEMHCDRLRKPLDVRGL